MALDIGSRIIELRGERGLSQEALANQLGLSRQAVSRWERGEALPDTENLIALADLFGISLDDLVRPSTQAGGQPGDDEAQGEDATEGEVAETLEEPETETCGEKGAEEPLPETSDGEGAAEDETVARSNETGPDTDEEGTSLEEADSTQDLGAQMPNQPKAEQPQGFWSTARITFAIILAVMLFAACVAVKTLGTDLLALIDHLAGQPSDFENALLDPNSHADVDGTQVHSLDIEAAVGSVCIEMADDDLADGNVRIFETYGEDGTDVRVPEWSLEDGTLRIEGGRGVGNTHGCCLYVYVPVGVMLNLQDVSLEVGNADLVAQNIRCASFELDVASGSAHVLNLEADELDVGCQSGYVLIVCGTTEDMDIQIGSGAGDVVIGDGSNMPATIKAEVDSGNLTFSLPENGGFTIRTQAPSQSINQSIYLAFDVMWTSDTIVFGEGSTQIEVAVEDGTVSFLPS